MLLPEYIYYNLAENLMNYDINNFSAILETFHFTKINNFTKGEIMYEKLKKYFNTVSKLLNDKGIALIHTIASTSPPRNPHPWITKYIFPGGYTPSLSQIARPIEDSGLIISDIEVLRMHYAHTLRHWKERFLAKKEIVLGMFDEKFYRMWEFYLASCEMAFKWGDQVVFQLQLTKDNTSVPTTRDYIY